MPTILDPKTVGMADDVAKMVMQNSRTVTATHKTASQAAKKSSKGGASATDTATATAAAVSLQQMNNEAAPNGVDRALEGTGTALGIFGMLPFIGGGALNLLGGGVKKVGGLFKSESVQKAGAKIQVPAKYVNETTFSELGKHTGIGESVGKAAQKVADVTATGAERASKATGIGNWFSTRAFGGAESHFRKMATHAQNVDLSKVHADILSDVATIQRHAGAANAGHLNKEFMDAVVSVEKKMEELGPQAAKEGALKPLRKMVTSAGHTAGKLEAAHGWANPAAAIKNAPKSLGKTTIAHGVMNGAFIAGSGISILSDAHSFKQKVAMLKEMIYDMTGKRVSTTTALFGSVPEAAREARSVILKSQSVKFAADAAGLFVNVKMALNNRIGLLKSTVAFMAPELISHAVDASMHDNLAVYAAFRRNALAKQAAGQKLEAGDYAPFVQELDSHLRSKGVAGQEFAAKLGEYYASIQATPGQVMKEIQEGKALARVHNIIEQNAALKTSAVEPNGISHAQRLAGEKKDLKVVGPHSGKVVSEVTTGAGITRP